MTELTQPSVTICPRFGCAGDSQVEDSRKATSWYVKRVRSCVKCGHRWTTAEVPLPTIKRMLKVDHFLKQLGQIQ